MAVPAWLMVTSYTILGDNSDSNDNSHNNNNINNIMNNNHQQSPVDPNNIQLTHNNHPGGDEELMCLGQLDHQQAMGSRLGRTPGLLCQPTLTHLGEKTCGKFIY